jgi:hypothetical protein
LTTIRTGKFMQPALGTSEPAAYVVVGDGLPKVIPESEYRAAGYEPPFGTLPMLDGVERAQETNATLSPDAHDDLSQRLRWLGRQNLRAEDRCENADAPE